MTISKVQMWQTEDKCVFESLGEAVAHEGRSELAAFLRREGYSAHSVWCSDTLAAFLIGRRVPIINLIEKAAAQRGQEGVSRMTTIVDRTKKRGKDCLP